ncbi:MAG: LD-carboxypeptidase [Oscillospiraceae bacterium]|nr:LD-carboxypeptidase [Oscillospiraceae bacterium]
MRIPKPLFPGARVALIAPASAVPEAKLQPALDYVRQLGLEPVVHPSCYFSNRDGYMAATDAQRAKEINEAFADPTIDGIWCIRGGYGCHRILPLLDLDKIAQNPKWFGGYSDVTALHTAFNQICGFETYHCTMPSTEPNPGDFTEGWLKKALFGELKGSIDNPENQKMKALVEGKAEGMLCGGNLSLLAASLGTPWEIDTKNKILFLEDIGEKTYRVDGMLTQLRNAGKFRDCAGIILGAWTDCDPEYPEKTLLLPEIFHQLIVPAGKPLVMDFACGHVLPTVALAMGRKVMLDAGNCTIELGGME